MGIKIRDVLGEKRKAKLFECGIPESMHGGIIRYYERGIPPGDFLQAVINNDLREACGRADDVNKHLLFNYMMWFYNNAPGGTWGYPKAVSDYLNTFQAERDAIEEIEDAGIGDQ